MSHHTTTSKLEANPSMHPGRPELRWHPRSPPIMRTSTNPVVSPNAHWPYQISVGGGQAARYQVLSFECQVLMQSDVGIAALQWGDAGAIAAGFWRRKRLYHRVISREDLGTRSVVAGRRPGWWPGKWSPKTQINGKSGVKRKNGMHEDEATLT